MRRNEIGRLLPAVYQRVDEPGTPLYALLSVMEALHEPSEEALRGLDTTLDPRRTAERFVPFLATWVDLAWLWTDEEFAEDSAGTRPLMLEHLGHLRELVASAASLSQHRGTVAGLVAFLELAAGTPGFSVEEVVAGPDGRPLPFHVRVQAPPSTNTPRLRALLTQIIEMEKPAYLTYALDFGDSSAGS